MATNPTQLASDIASALGHSGNVTQQVTGFAQGILGELTQNGTAAAGPIPGPYPITGLSGSSMASKVASAAGYGSVSSVLLNYCTAIANHITSQGLVTYVGPGGDPPTYFLGGTISGLNGSTMATSVASMAGYPSVSTELLNKCNAIVNHIQSNALVNSGTIA